MLRIAFSVVCCIACVLLCVLWVRSYWIWDRVIGQNGHGFKYSIASCRGKIGFGWLEFLDPWDKHRLGNEVFPSGWDSQRVDLWELPIQHDHMATGAHTLSPAGKFWCTSTDPTVLISYGHIAFPLAVIGVVVALPWIRWSNQFSLRTLLIATTLVCVVLGLIVWAVR